MNQHGPLARSEAARALRAYRERMRPAWDAAAKEAARLREEREAERKARILKVAEDFMARKREPGEDDE